VRLIKALLVGVLLGLTLVAIFALAGCGPVNGPPKQPSFYLIFENQSSTAQVVSVTYWWTGYDMNGTPLGTYSAQLGEKVQPHTSAPFRIDRIQPDLVDVRAGWGHLSWSGPDYSGYSVLHVVFPSGASWAEDPIK